MVTTSLSFIHFRGQRGLAKRVRKDLKDIHGLLFYIKKYKDLKKEDFEKGKESQEYKDFIELLNTFLKEEKLIDDALEDENIILYRQIKKEKKNEHILLKIIDKHKNYSERLKPIINELKQIDENLNAHLDKSRLELKHLIENLDLSVSMQFNSIYGDGQILFFDAHKAYDVRVEAPKIKKELRDLNKELENLEKAFSKNDLKKIDNKIEEIGKLVHEVKGRFDSELKNMREIFHDLNVIDYRLLKEIRNEILKDVQKLRENGFNPKLADKIEKKVKKVSSKITDEKFPIYREIRIEQQKMAA